MHGVTRELIIIIVVVLDVVIVVDVIFIIVVSVISLYFTLFIFGLKRSFGQISLIHLLPFCL